jgi:ATP-dependent Clp protease ATP-binding subunit ClpA
MTECGIKKIHLDIGYKYTSAAGQRERIDNMKKMVVSQLERCPRSLIIFDDFQWAPEMMILSLRDAFDDSMEALTYRDKRVSTSRAIFVFCSDLESEQRHLSENMTMEQARMKVSELAASQWKMVDQTSSFGKLFVSDGMVPFVPLSEPELRKVIHIEMGKLTPRVERFLTFNANNHSVEFKWLGRVTFF